MKTFFTTISVCILTVIHAQYSNGFQEVSKIVASDREMSEEFGNAVDVSGSYAVVANYKESEDENGLDSLHYAGAVYVYEKQLNGGWVQVQKIVASDRAINDNFGFSVAIEGTTIVVGARYEDEDQNGTNTLSASGSAYIFERNMAGVWNQTQKIVGSNRGIALQWGWDVEINGNYLAIGTYNDSYDENGMNPLSKSGSLNMFEKNGGGIWVETQKIVASDRADFDWFAYDFDIDDDVMVVGAAGLNHEGKVYVYNRDGSGVWNETQIITATDIISGSKFGENVSISSDYIVVGAVNENEDESDLNTLNTSGSVYVFKVNGNGVWEETQKIVASDRSIFDRFGCEVSISNRLIVVGAYSADMDYGGVGTGVGAAYIYELDVNNQWVENEKLIYSDNSSADQFGEHVAISEKNIISSARSEDEDVNGMNTLNNSGSAYIFETCFSSTNTISPVSCDSYNSPSGNYVWTASNTYQDTIQNNNGCDSVITINLTVTTANSSVTQNSNVLTATQTGATYQWVDCDNGNTPMSGETNQEFTATENGNYAVEVTTGDGCTATSTCYVIEGLGAGSNNTLNGKLIKLYPNPTNGNFTIDLNETQLKLTIQIVDVTGKVVYENNYENQSSIQLNLDIPNGIYFVKVISSNQQSVIKLIKQ